MKIKGKGKDRFGLPSTGTKEQTSIRNNAIARYNKAIREQSKMVEKANELRFYRNNGTATPKQLQKLQWLESQGY